MEDLLKRIISRRSGMVGLKPLPLSSELKLVTGTFEGESLFIWNELKSCRGFRKLHLEVAMFGAGLQILHCVFFPEPSFDLPIFGVDVVAGPSGISAAIVDLSPVQGDLPGYVLQQLNALPKPSFNQVRELPAWGSIFSPFVQFIRPDGILEEQSFSDIVENYLQILISSLDRTNPDEPHAPTTIQRHNGQLLYCLQQKRNDKTRRVLEKAFNPQWAKCYIEELMFDSPPPL